MGQIHTLYLASNVYEPKLYNSIDAEVYGEIVDYLGPYWDNSEMMRYSKGTHTTRRRQERNEVVVCMSLPGLVVEYCLREILTVDVSQVEFLRSPVVGESTEENIKEKNSQ